MQTFVDVHISRIGSVRMAIIADKDHFGTIIKLDRGCEYADRLSERLEK